MFANSCELRCALALVRRVGEALAGREGRACLRASSRVEWQSEHTSRVRCSCSGVRCVSICRCSIADVTPPVERVSACSSHSVRIAGAAIRPLRTADPRSHPSVQRCAVQHRSVSPVARLSASSSNLRTARRMRSAGEGTGRLHHSARCHPPLSDQRRLDHWERTADPLHSATGHTTTA